MADPDPARFAGGLSGLDPDLTAAAHVTAAAAELEQRLPLELVVSTAWRYRALEADVIRRRIREAPALFTPAGAEVAELEYSTAGAWATWWQFTSYGVVGRLP